MVCLPARSGYRHGALPRILGPRSQRAVEKHQPHEDTADAREALGEMTVILERVPGLLAELANPIR